MKYYYIMICIFKLPYLLAQSQNETSINSTSKINFDKCRYGTVFNGNSCDDCSKNYFQPNLENRIVGGIKSNPYSWPAQIFLKIRASGTYRGITYYSDTSCGGTLINRFTVLTAGHCIITKFQIKICYYFGSCNSYYYDYVNVNNPFDSTQYTVYLGAYDINNLNQTPAVQMSVKKVIRHPSFDSINILNDLAILQLDGQVPLNKYIQPSCLSNPNYGIDYPSNYNISTVYTSGWGLLNSGSDTISNILYNVQLNSYPPLYCSNVASEYLKNWDSQICAGDYSGGKDSCNGDSGSGLYSFDSNLQRYVVIGLTSYGIESCALPGYPAIYTRIGYFYDWILANSKYDITSTTSTFQSKTNTTNTKTTSTITTSRGTTKVTNTNTLSTITTSRGTTKVTNTKTSSTRSTKNNSLQTSYSLFLIISSLISIVLTHSS